MPLFVPRTSMPAQPGTPSMAGGSAVVPVQAIGSPAAAGARVAQEFAGRAAEIYQQERDREIATRVRELDVQRRTADAEVLNGYRQALGKDAVDGRGEAMAAIAGNSKRVREGIADREVAMIWKQQDAQLTLAAQDELDGHYRQQNIKWQADTHEARADLLVGDLERVAFGEGFDPATGRLSDEAERTRSAYRDELTRLGGLMGWDASVTEKHVRDADSAAFGAVAESLVRQERFAEARAVLEKHKDRIDEGGRQQLLQAARQGQERVAATAARSAIKDESTRLAMQIPGEMVKEARALRGSLNQNDPIEDPRKSPTYLVDATAKLDELFTSGSISAEVRDATIDRLGADATAYRQQDARETEAVMGAAEKWLVDNPLAAVSAMPPKLYVEIERRGQLGAINGFAESRRYTTDPTAFAEVQRYSDEFLRKKPPAELWVDLRGKLNNRDLDDVMARQARALGSATAEQLHVISIGDRLEATARQLGILPKDGSKASEAQQLEFDQWRAQFDAQLQSWQQSNKKKAGTEDVQQLLDLQARDRVERVSKGLVWDSIESTPLARVPEGRSGSAWVMVRGERIATRSIPESKYSELAALLVESGEEPTVANIADYWVALGRPGEFAGAPAMPAKKAAAAAVPATPALSVYGSPITDPRRPPGGGR